MPSKNIARNRTRTRSREQHKQAQLQTQQRAWGTRFDSLTASPPLAPRSSAPSPSSAPSESSASASAPTSPSPARGGTLDSLSLDLFGENAKPTARRDWADDEVPSTLRSPRVPFVLDTSGAGATATPGRKDFQKMPHDASVFIGSLPTDVDEAEMALALAEHLAQFAKVQNIKIIHDTKGGLCAFVQCENSEQASQLVSRAQSDQKPFMNRYIRYENARARRSLWISYQTPMHFEPCKSQDEEDANVVVDDNGVKGHWVESELPNAMRIWKPRDVRFPIVTYREDAINISSALRSEGDPVDVSPAFQVKGVLFTDLKCDADTMRRMAETFGPLESFKSYMSVDGSTISPEGHDGDRSPGMDPGVWEVKWGHRDDCMTALNTLRRIPHLAVSWVKDFPYSQTPIQRHSILRSPASPRYPASYSPREAVSPITHARPLLLLKTTNSAANDCGFRSAADSGPTSASSFTRSPNVGTSPQRGRARLNPSLTRRGNEPMQRALDTSAPATTEESDDGWTVVRSQNITHAIMSSLSVNTGSGIGSPVIADGGDRNGPEWGEGDFPPLKTVRCASVERLKIVEVEEMPPSPKFVSLNDPTPPSPAGERLALASVANSEVTTPSRASPVGEIPNLPRPLVIHRRSLSNPVARLQPEDPSESPNTQTLEIPPTPELADASLTHTPTSARQEPTTPMHLTMAPLAAPDFAGQQQHKFVEHAHSNNHEHEQGEGSESALSGPGPNSGFVRREHHRHGTLDPKTIFVGGLDPHRHRPWDEERLRAIFEKYGKVQDVRIHNPVTKKTGFAFITFLDEDSLKKAIRGEHDRLYDGRPIRVQQRDMFPHRGGFGKFRGRGMGRRPFGFEPHINIGHHPNAGRHNEQGPQGIPHAIQLFEQHMVHNEGDRLHTHFRMHPHAPLVSSASAETDSATLRSSTSYDMKHDSDILHESDSRTAVSITPPPSIRSTSTSTSAAVAPITPHVQAGAYYPPHAWSSPYGSQMHYPMQYGAYSGMMPGVPMHVAPAAQGTDPNSANGNAPVQWGPMYRGVPFAPYPYMIVPPAGAELARSGAGPSQSTTPIKDQPPLQPTGFIQGEHGSLIPLYQPDALHEYMNGSSPIHHQGQTHAPTSTTGSAMTGPQPQGFIAAAQMWPGYSHPPQYIAYPVPTTSASAATGVPHSGTPPAVAQQQVIHQQIHGQIMQTPSANSYLHPGVVPASHPNANQQQQQPVIFQGGSAGPGMPPPYYATAQPNVGAPHVEPARVGPHVSHTTHGNTPERHNSYLSKHPPRRDQGSYHGRNAHGPGPNNNTVKSSPASQSANRLAATPRGDPHQNNNIANSFQQRQHHAHANSHIQLGFNNHIPDGGHSQHQWITNPQQ